MPLYNTGKEYNLYGAILEQTELTEQSVNLGLSSEIAESTTLNSVYRVDGTQNEIKLADSLIENLYSLFNYDLQLNAWSKVDNFTRISNKIVLNKPYSGLLLAFPFDAFRDSFYTNGDYIYEMYLNRLDYRVYRNIIISSSTFLQSPYVTLLFSFSSTGPWLPQIQSSFLFSTFYMKVSISNKHLLNTTQVIPSEIISLSCLVCE